MMTFLYILLFIVCLSTLVMIHELGHLLTAKMFKVYCFEYSIGFGPKLFSFKRKGGETAFSLRAVPFGGFVSMYGEAETVPEGLEIDPKRSLLNIAKWKRAVIMVAGVAMNFLLALVIFIAYEGFFPKYQSRYAHVTINDSSIAETIGLKSEDFVYAQTYSDSDHSFIFYDDNALLTYEDDSTKDIYLGINFGELSIKDTSLLNHPLAYNKLSKGEISKTAEEITIKDVIDNKYDKNKEYLITGFVSGHSIDQGKNLYHFAVSTNFSESSKNDQSIIFSFDTTKVDSKILGYIPNGQEISVVGKISKNSEDGFQYVTISENNYHFCYIDIDNGNWFNKKYKDLRPVKVTFHSYVVDEAHPSGRGNVTYSFNDIALTDKDGSYRLPDNIGINMQLDTYRNTFGQTFVKAFQDFGNAGSLIYRSLGMLFTDANAWKNVGGIIAIGVTTTQVLKENGFGMFLYYWALISVNLGIVNLLPFPGLDGWHFLVIIVEGITKKEIPPKVKNWFQIIGLVLLFALMILVIIKDLITYI